MHVLVVCKENWDTLAEIPFILKRGGCIVDVFCSNQSWLLTNRFYDNWIERKPSQEFYIPQLIELVEASDYDWVVLGDDVIIKQLNEINLSPELFSKLLPITAMEYRSILSSKIGLSNFCLNTGIQTPRYHLYNNESDLEQIKFGLNFPVINKIDFSWGGANMFVSKDFESFKRTLHNIPQNQNIMIQEFVLGEEVPVEALFFKGELLVYMTSRILQFDKGPFTLSTRRLYYKNEEVKPLLEELGKKLGITGFANIAYMKEYETAIYKLIEVDIRPNSWMAYGRFCGNDFSAAIKKFVTVDTSKMENKSWNSKTNFEIALFYKDMRRCFWQKDYRGIFRWILNFQGYWRYIPFYDAKLTKIIFQNLWKIISYKIKKIFFKNKEVDFS